MIAFAVNGFGQNAWINELHYDNAGSDVGEFVEIVIENPGSYPLSDFTVHLYNGNDGTTYNNDALDNFTVGTTVGSYTIYTWYPSSIQNGVPDGLALLYQGTVISGQFLSYEGSFTATDGPVSGVTSVDMGVSESGSTPVGESLQLSGSGTAYSNFTWQPPALETPGNLNNNQSFGGAATARIVGSMQGWNATDPAYVMALNANGLYELTKSLDAGDHTYKVLEGDDWSAPNYPGTDQHVILSATENVTWKVNITDELVTHLNPVVAGNFLSAIGGTNWDPSELMGEMSDPDGDDIFTLELTIPAGNYEGKVTLNHNLDQSTGSNVPFTTDGVNPTIFTYDFPNNITTISGPSPPTATFTFIVEDVASMNYDGFFLKGSWDANGQYDPSWDGGAEHSGFYDDGTNGDVVAGDHIWTCQFDLVVDGGSNTWEWGVNDTEHNWIAGNWQFTVPDQTPQTLTWIIPDVVDLVINEIMYNSPGADEEWIELYNNTGQTIDLENWNICDNDASHTHIVIPAGYSIATDSYFTISISTDGAFPFTPDYDGTGNFGLNNGGDGVRIWNPDTLLVDIVNYDDSSPWPAEPDGNGPSLSLIDPDTDNSLGESWAASLEYGGTPGVLNFPPVPFVTIADPNGGEFATRGEPYEITWIYDFWTGNIEIYLVKEGVNPQLLVSNISVEDESWTWNVFATQEPGNDYKIMIVPINPDDPGDESDDYFSIIVPYVFPEIVITEIMYNPPESGTDSLEFIELYNNGVETVNLAGFCFTEGVVYTFPNIDLLSDNYLLVSVDSVAMMATFGVEARQWTSGALSNGGEKIELRDSLDNIIDSLTYDDNLPWDILANGFGPSLTLCNPDVDNSIAENWTHSVNFAVVNAEGDSIWATPGFACQVELIAGFEADVTYISVGDSVLFTDLTIGNPIDWTWTFEGGTPDAFFGQTPPAIQYNEEGMWDVTLLVSDGVNTTEITYEDYIEVVNFPAPTNLEAVVGPFDDVWLTWNVPDHNEVTVVEPIINQVSNFRDLLGYNVYRDDVQINAIIVEVKEYNDQEPPIGPHDYYVTAVYDGGESGPSNIVSVVVTDIYEVTANSVVIYPNPTEGLFTIEFVRETVVDVSIMDITGKEIYCNTLNKTSQINISGMQRGMYLVRLLDSSTNIILIKKLIVNTN